METSGACKIGVMLSNCTCHGKVYSREIVSIPLLYHQPEAGVYMFRRNNRLCLCIDGLPPGGNRGSGGDGGGGAIGVGGSMQR